MRMQSQVVRGANAGTLLTPHRYADGTYVVSKTRFKEDYVYVHNLSEVSQYLSRGYKLRMSNQGIKSCKAPSLISTASIRITD